MPDEKAPGSEDFAAMLAEYEGRDASHGRTRDPQIGDQVRGRVVSIGHEAVFVDLGAKSEGMIELSDVRGPDGKLTVGVGDVVEARVIETAGKAGCIVLRHALGRGRDARGDLEHAFRHAIPVEGVVQAVNKGGVEVQMAGLRAFCPISQLDIRHVEDAGALVGQRLAFRITRYEQGKGAPNIVLSRRVLLQEEQDARATATRERLAVGAILTGRVTTLKDYGAFVDLGGLEGMIHISELGFARVAHPRDVLSVGQEVEVQVLKLDQSADDRRALKISLSLRSLARDPWSDLGERYAEGTRATGQVLRLEPFGAFVELAPGVEGLVHISELGSGRRVNHPREVLKIGQKIDVTVLSVDLEKRRLSLALAADDEASPDQAELPRAPRTLGTLGDLIARKRK
jgi:small subunit ribosomal protein S1